MLIFTRSLRVCLAVDPVDLRKSFENRGHPLKLSISLPLQWVSMISSGSTPGAILSVSAAAHPAR